jgi:hypothetical protein
MNNDIENYDYQVRVGILNLPARPSPIKQRAFSCVVENVYKNYLHFCY